MAEYEGTPESVMALSDDELEQVLAGLEDQMRRMNLARDALDEFCPVGAGMLYKLTDQLLLHCTEATQREMRRYRAGTPVATRTARQVSDGHGGVRDNGRPGERAGHSGAKVVADDSRQPGRAVVSTAVLSSNNTAVDKTEKTAGLPRNHEFTFECATPAKLAKNGSRVPLPPPPATPPVRHPAERLHPVAGAGQAKKEKGSKNRGVKRVEREENQDDRLKAHHKEKRRKLHDNASKADKPLRRQGEQATNGEHSRPAGAAPGRRTRTDRECRILTWRADVASSSHA